MCAMCSAETGKVKLDALWFLPFVVTLNLRELGWLCACGFWSLTALKLGAEWAASTSEKFLASRLRMLPQKAYLSIQFPGSFALWESIWSLAHFFPQLQSCEYG